MAKNCKHSSKARSVEMDDINTNADMDAEASGILKGYELHELTSAVNSSENCNSHIAFKALSMTYRSVLIHIYVMIND
jgi:hypothetical protein